MTTAPKSRYNFLLDKQVYDDFSALCNELGLVRGKNIERYMRQFIEQNKDVLAQMKGRQHE